MSAFSNQGGKKDKRDALDFGFKPGPKADFATEYDAWHASDRGPEANVAFLQAVKPVIDAAVKSYSDVDDPVIRTKAQMLALSAAPKWQRDKANLRTYLMTQLQPLHRVAAQRRHVVNLPERLQYDMTRYKEALAELQDDNDREPSDLDLSERLHMPLQRIRRLREGSMGTMSDGSFLDSGAMPAVEADKRPEDDPWTQAVYYELTPTDRFIFEARTGFNGRPAMGVTDIARKLGISAGRVSQRAKSIDARMADRPEGW